MPKVTNDFLNGVVNYVEATGTMLSKQAELENKVSRFGPAVVDTLIKRGFLNENGRAEAIAATRDHLKVLESLQKTAEEVDRRKKVASAEVSTMGKGEDSIKVVPQGSNEVLDAYGRRASSEKQAAERAFLRQFLGTA
jgi:hypothetical protein